MMFHAKLHPLFSLLICVLYCCIYQMLKPFCANYPLFLSTPEILMPQTELIEWVSSNMIFVNTVSQDLQKLGVVFVQSILVEFKSTAGQKIALYVLVSCIVNLLSTAPAGRSTHSKSFCYCLVQNCKQCLDCSN